MSQCPAKNQLSPLHTHTVYSVLDGASSIDEYLKWCKENGARGFGTTDHGWVIGALENYHKCKKAGLIPLPGCEFYVAPDKDYKFSGKPYDYYHVTVWATSEVGYRNLIKLASKAWQQDKLSGGKRKRDGADADRVVSMWGGRQLKPRITFQELLDHHEGLVLGTGCLIGALNKAFLNGEFQGAERNLLKLLEVFKGRTFVEVMPHSCGWNYSREHKKFLQNTPLSFDECKDFSPDGQLQVACNKKSIEVARKYDLPLLLTVDSHFVRPDQKRLQDVLLSTSDDGWSFHESYHMYTTEMAWTAWQKIHGSDAEQKKIFQEACENNETLVDLAKDLVIHDEYRQPEPVIPVDILAKKLSPAEERKATLIRWVDHHGRMKWDEPLWVERLMMEISVICDNGIIDFSPYFIFLEDVYRWAAENSIFAAPGRGSGAGSLLCYCLKITSIDPMDWNLPFERFLSQARLERGKFPDLDCDFGSRDALIAFLRERFGDKMAQCSTLGTLKVKSAIKDACRAILSRNAQDPEIDALTKTIPNEPQGVASKDWLLGYTDQDGHVHEGHLAQNPALEQFFERYPLVRDAVVQLLGIPRSVGRHASAFLISDRPISESVPTCVISGYVCTQYQATASNNMVEKAGLIKFDFLRVNTLDDISNCIRLVQRKFGHKVWEERITFGGEEFRITRGDLAIDRLPMPDGRVLDIYELPEDPSVFEELSSGRTETVFQMNSSLMTGFTKRIRPRCIRDLSDIVALVRPGPLLASVGELDDEGRPLTMTEAYIARRNGKIPVRYAHPMMERHLSDTFGVAVYQEQIQAMFMDPEGGGYSASDADYLRETLAKKKRQDMERELPKLRSRLKERGWTDTQAEVFVGLCISSSAYSFNRAHSASYGTVAYQCAFLKKNFPVEWFTAVLQNAKVEDIREKGYANLLMQDGLLELPTVNGPTDTFLPEENRVKAPLYLIDRVGDVASKEIREKRGSEAFKSLQDFVERVDPRKVNEGVIHNLILCDAFRNIEPGRSIESLIEEYQYLKKVSALKIGEGKRGEALRAAIDLYKSKEVQKGTRLWDLKIESPELYSDPLQIEVARCQAMPIYRMNVHKQFQQLLSLKSNLLYGEKEITVFDPTLGGDVRVYPTIEELSEDARGYKGVRCAWAGLIQGSDTFQYTDKKTNKRVTALKLQIANDGEALEAILWPDLYVKLGNPKTNRIVIVFGFVKEAREPGKWSMSVQRLEYV